MYIPRAGFVVRVYIESGRQLAQGQEALAAWAQARPRTPLLSCVLTRPSHNANLGASRKRVSLCDVCGGDGGGVAGGCC
jgi:hypothetical protein